eukprot:5755157-Prymnesium_polylepis.1
MNGGKQGGGGGNAGGNRGGDGQAMLITSNIDQDDDVLLKARQFVVTCGQAADVSKLTALASGPGGLPVGPYPSGYPMIQYPK